MNLTLISSPQNGSFYMWPARQIRCRRTFCHSYHPYCLCESRETGHRHPYEVLDTVGGCQFGQCQEPRFISYDYWCSGIGPDLLQPVGDVHEQWERLLNNGGPWPSFYASSPAPEVLCVPSFLWDHVMNPTGRIGCERVGNVGRLRFNNRHLPNTSKCKRVSYEVIV
jgi:hypothetical protein